MLFCIHVEFETSLDVFDASAMGKNATTSSFYFTIRTFNSAQDSVKDVSFKVLDVVLIVNQAIPRTSLFSVSKSLLSRQEHVPSSAKKSPL